MLVYFEAKKERRKVEETGRRMPLPSIINIQLEAIHIAVGMDEAGKTHCPTRKKIRLQKQAPNAVRGCKKFRAGPV